MQLDLDIIVFLLFLLMNLFIGVSSMPRLSTLRQYSVGSKGFTVASIAASIITISYGGGIFYNILDSTFLLILIGSAISYFIIGTVLSKRLGLFLNCCSVAEIMGQLYGTNVRKIVAICGIINGIGATAIHVSALAQAISLLFGVDHFYSLLISTTFIIFSVGAGGIQSLTLVSIIRCAIFVIFLPTIAWILWKHLINQHDYDQFHLALAIKESWHSLNFSSASNPYTKTLLVFAIPTLYPAQVQRILIAENDVQIKKSFNYAGLFSLIINLFLLWIALLLNKTFGNIPISDVPSSVFQTYIGLKGLFVIGIAALTISTASVNLHSSTVLIMNDLQNQLKYNKITSITSMKIRSYTFFVGLIVVLFIQFSIKKPFQLLLITQLPYKPIVAIPLLLALVGFRFHRYAVLFSMIISFLYVSFSWFYTPNIDIADLLINTMYINLLSIFVVHFLLVLSKWIILKVNPKFSDMGLFVEVATKVPPLWIQFYEYGKYVLSKINSFKPLGYLQKQLPRNSSYYVLFSFYIAVTGYCSFYTFSSNAIWGSKLENLVLFPSLFVATFFLVYSSVTLKLYSRKIIAIIWELSNLYFLAIAGSCMVILSQFSHLQVIIFIVNISLSILASSLGIVIFRTVITALVIWKSLAYLGGGLTLINSILSLNISVIYVTLMLFIFLGGLLYHKENLRKLFLTIQELRDEQEEQNSRQFFKKQQIEALAYESSYVLNQVHNQLLRLSQLENNELIAPVQDQVIKLKKYYDSVFAHLRHGLYLATNWINIDQLLLKCLDAIEIEDIYHSPYVVSNSENFYIQCDIERITTLIVNSINACRQCDGKNRRRDTHIYISDTQLGYRPTLLEGKIQRVSAISFIITTEKNRPAILPIYKVPEMTDVQIVDKIKEMDQTDIENHHIVSSHYGYCEITHFDLDVTHLYVIPVNVQKVTKAFAALSPVVYTQNVELDPISMREEAMFIQKVQETNGIDFDTIKDVLELIKVYYATQRRKTGELFYLHPMAVASTLLDIVSDSDLIIAGLAHDIVRNTPFTKAGLSTLIGAHIMTIICDAKGLEKQLPLAKEAYYGFIQEIVNDPKYHNAILLRLADVSHNAKTIHGHNMEKQVKKATLIQQFYRPLAIQMNVPTIVDELNRCIAKVLNISY